MANAQWTHQGYAITIDTDGKFCYADTEEDQHRYDSLALAREAIDRAEAHKETTQRERLSIPAYASNSEKIIECEITGVHAGTLDLLTKPKFSRWNRESLYFRCATVKTLLDKEHELETALDAVRESLTPFKLKGYSYSERKTHEAVVARIKADVARMEAADKE